MKGLDYYQAIVGSVFKRYLEGNSLHVIDRINYYKAREKYYKIKSSNTQDIDDFQRFERKRLVSRIERKHLEFKVAA